MYLTPFERLSIQQGKCLSFEDALTYIREQVPEVADIIVENWHLIEYGGRSYEIGNSVTFILPYSRSYKLPINQEQERPRVLSISGADSVIAILKRLMNSAVTHA